VILLNVDRGFRRPKIATARRGQQKRDPTDFDIRHTFVAAVTYDFPALKNVKPFKAVFGDWLVDAIGRYRSAQPFSVITHVVDPLNVGSTRHVSVKPGVPVNLDDLAASGGKLLTPGAFAVPAAGCINNTSATR